jgi:hypothetical protein
MNLTSLEELKQAIKMTHDKSKKISFVVNEVGYSDIFLKPILNKILQIDSMGIDAFIVADINLMSILSHEFPYNKIKAKLFLSSVAPAFNPKAVEFYKQFNVKRIILPQHLYPAEYAQIKENIDIETEVFFFKTNYCRCIDGHCFYTYNNQIWKKKILLDVCDHISSIKKYTWDDKLCSRKENIKSYFNYYYPFGLNPYGAVYDYHKLGVDLLKLGNREVSSNEKKKCIRLTAYMVKLLEQQDMTRKKFVQKSRIKAASLFY